MAGLILAGLALGWAGPVRAEGFWFMGPWQGQLEGRFEFDREETKSGKEPRVRFESTEAQEVLTLRNPTIHVYDPRFLTLSVEGSFGLAQERITDTAGQVGGFRNGTLWGYDLLAQFLSDQPLALRLFANRTQSLLPLGRPGQSEFESETRGAVLEARYLPIPSTLTFRQELTNEESRGQEGVVGRRQEDRTILTYEGRRGFVDAELDLRYEFVDLADRVTPRLSYQSHEGMVNYSLDFGPGNAWRWDSRLRAYSRQGGSFQGVSTDLTTWLVDESLRIDHTERLQTRYRYLFVSTDTTGGRADTHTGTLALAHQLYESLHTTATAEGIHQELEDGTKDVASARLDFAYTKRLPGGGRLTAGLGGFVAYEDDRFRGPESFVPQEMHTAATPFAVPIPLANPFVVETSVTVTKVTLGPLPLGCVPPPGPPTPLLAGQDYTFRTVGAVTQIVPAPCGSTTVGINPGDTIAVDYRFDVSPALAFTTLGWRADGAIDYGWFRVYAAYDQSDQNLVSGRDGRFLDDERTGLVGAELRHDGERLTASLLAEARRYTSTRLSYDTLRFSQSASMALWRDLTLSLVTDETLDDYRSEKRQSRLVAGRATLTYRLDADLLAELAAGVSYLDDTVYPTEELRDCRLLVRWRLRKLEVNPILELFDRRRGDVDTREFRATLQLIRRF